MEKITIQEQILEKIIPAHTVSKVVYQAIDGKEFENEYACKAYEEELRKEQSYIQKQRIRSTSDNEILEFDSGYYAQLFYVHNMTDIEAIEDVTGRNFFTTRFHNNRDTYYDTDYCDFEKYGEGWYLFWTEPQGDYPDDRYLINWEHYINQHIKAIQNYMNQMQNIIDIKTKELQEFGIIEER